VCSSSRTAAWLPASRLSLDGLAHALPTGLVRHAAAALAAAIAVQQLPALPGAAWAVPGAILALLALERPSRYWLLTAVLAFAWTATTARARLDDWLPAARSGNDFAVTGWVDSFPAGEPARKTFSFRVEAADDDAVPRRLRLSWYDAPEFLVPGARLALRVRLRRPRGLVNPGGFDYEQWLLTQGIGATGYVRAGAGEASRPGVEPRVATGSTPARDWLRFRARIAADIEAAVPSRSAAALLIALTIGERYGFDEREWTDLQRSGTSHLVAISGSHIVFVALLVFAAVRGLCLHLPGVVPVRSANGRGRGRGPHARAALARVAALDLEIAGAASIAAAFGYAALAGFGVPIQRSVVMVAIALAVLVSRRSVRAVDALAAAALAVLAWDPFAAASASFWLSFGAVALLLALGARRDIEPADGTLEARRPQLGAHGRPRSQRGARGRQRPQRGARERQRPLRRAGERQRPETGAPEGRRAYFRDARRFTRTLTRLQIGVSLGAMPIAALYFGRISLISPLSNLVAIPYFTFALVPPALAGALGAAAGVPGSELLLRVTGVLADWAWAGIHAAAAPAWASLPAAAGAPWALGLAFAGVAAALPAHPLPGRRWAWCALLPILLPLSSRPESGAVKLQMLDVGHGLAVIVDTHSHRLLYDAGPRSRTGFDAGGEIVVPALQLDARVGLDRLVVSHADEDHAGGAAAVLDAFPAADILAGPDVHALGNLRIPAGGRVCESGQHWRWDGVEFRVLHPLRDERARGNDSSCVLKITAGGRSVLLTGDIEARAEARLAAREDISADVVVVPHHGSATSSTRTFVERTGAHDALVSAAFESRWHFPRPEVVGRWQAAGARVWVTGAVGALTVTLNGDGVAVSALRLRSRRYWRTFSVPSPGARGARAL
jgi:competence protein ComEC